MAAARTRSRTSLSTRIFVAFAVVVACSGLATFYAIATVATLRHELGFLRQRALPLLDELRQSEVALRGFDEALQRAAPHDLEWVVRFVPNARPYQRVDQILGHTRVVREFATPPRLAQLLTGQQLPLPVLDSSLAALRADHQAHDRMVQDPELLAATGGLGEARTDAAAFEVLVAGLQRATAEKRLADVGRIVVEIRRIIRHVHDALARAQRQFERVLNARFEAAEHAEGRLQVLVLSASVLSLAISVTMLLLMLATMRPMTALTDVVRRFAAGDRKARAAEGGASEVATLAVEWNSMADALALREAQLSAQREDLARSERLAALGHMAARMVHEVRNPLSSISLNAELLDEEVSRGDAINATEARELITAIGSEIERLRGITEGYLARARPPVTEHARVPLAELAGNLLDFVRSELERRGVQSTLDAQPVHIEGDQGLLRQALWNLVRNAWEAMPDGGQLWLEVSARDGEAVLAVEDSGPGVPEAMREAIFQPFTTTKEAGTGIGLALVREAAQGHRGRVALVPARHGGGARFEVVLPLVS